MSIGQICTRDTVIIRHTESVLTAARLMREHHVGSVVVVTQTASGAKPVGILTDRDLTIEIMATGLDPALVTAGDVVRTDLLTGHEDDGIWDTLQRMQAAGIRRLPVVNAGSALIGLLSMDDLLELLAGELGDMVKLIRHEREHETKSLSKITA
ncbi:MAG: CBS domain-containing protein [Methylococcaceae bacterium]|jgi:CBS domain-containing protein